MDHSPRLQQMHPHATDVPHPLFRVQELQPHQAQRLGRTHQLVIPHRVRTVSWNAPATSSDDEDAAVHAAEAKIEVALQCRPKEAMRAVLSAAAEAWRVAKDNGVEADACAAAAGVAAELTIVGLPPKEAGEKAAQTAASKGIGAVKNLILQHRAEQQRQQQSAAAAAALRRAQEAADVTDSASEDDGGANRETTVIQENTQSSSFSIAPDSAAAVSHGVHIPQQLVDTATSESVLRYAEYFDKRLEVFIALLVEEIRDLATSTWKLVEDRLLIAADSKEAKVFYLQLSADAVRYASQVMLDSQEAERLRRQSLQIYQIALALFDTTPKEGEEEEETLLSTRMGLVLNYAVLLHDEPDGVQKAIDALAAEFREAVANVVHIT
ncbi:hypothetical protein ACSSS7_002839 [Eimeria intestinalis]